MSRTRVLCGRALGLMLVSATLFIALVLVANHVNPCHPRNMGQCGLRLRRSLQGLDAARDPVSPSQQAATLCPPLVETLDCYYWFSQRCLPEREHLYYAKLYVESNAVSSRLCHPSVGDAPLLLSSGECIGDARARRAQCSERFSAQLADPEHSHSLMDSLYDDEGLGTFRAPFCMALREFMLCALHLIRDSCGYTTALHFQDLQLNVTQLIFGNKCDAALTPALPPPFPVMTHFNPAEDLRLLLAVLIFIPMSVIIFKQFLRPRSS